MISETRKPAHVVQSVDPNNKSIRSLSEDKQFSKIFSTYKICTEEKAENKKNMPLINAFKTFNHNKLYKELFMPTKKVSDFDEHMGRHQPSDEPLFKIQNQGPCK